MTDVISITRRGLMFGGSVIAGGVAATSSAKRALAQVGPTERLVYVGCYTPPGEGIVLYRVNANTGAMTQVRVFSGISNPSWIALDPLHRVLYAVNEDEPSGGVSAFTVDQASGDLKLINKVDSRGKWPCHLSVHPSGKFVLVANYGTGNASVFPILANGGLGDPTDMESDTGALHPPKAADNPPGNFAPSDHTGPKMHMIQTDPSGQFVIANDAGLDKTLIWTLDLQTGKLTPAATPSVPSTPGSAPRHFAFLPNGRVFYNLHEQDGIVTAADFDPKTGAMKEKQSISVLPKGFAGSNLCSELAVSPDGRFVYAAARGHDAIAQLGVGAGGELTWASEAWTHADYPRSFAIDPAGRFLFACNQKGDAVTSFQIDPHSGGLTFTGQFVPVGAPVTMTFLS